MKTHKEMMQALLNGDTLVNESKQDIKLQENGIVQMFTAQGKYETIVTFKPENWKLKKMKNKKLEQLLKQKQEIEEQIEKLQKKWQPIGGSYPIYWDATVDESNCVDENKLFGTERPTQEQAEKARDKMRVFNRLLAYHDEYCPDYDFIPNTDNYYIQYDDIIEEYTMGCEYKKSIGKVYFCFKIAKELIDKLNSGEVEL